MRFSARPLPLLNFSVRLHPLVCALFQKIPQQPVPQLSFFPLELQSSSLFALHPPQLHLLFTPKLRLLLTLNLGLFLQTGEFCLLSLQLLQPHGLRMTRKRHVTRSRREDEVNVNGVESHLGSAQQLSDQPDGLQVPLRQQQLPFLHHDFLVQFLLLLFLLFLGFLLVLLLFALLQFLLSFPDLLLPPLLLLLLLQLTLLSTSAEKAVAFLISAFFIKTAGFSRQMKTWPRPQFCRTLNLK